ncbi:MAG: hypothetical protein IJK75_07580, partial [Bacteroidales bacterium]|nr:hypothetical protein [Bacteroidales bacterium]
TGTPEKYSRSIFAWARCIARQLLASILFYLFLVNFFQDDTPRLVRKVFIINEMIKQMVAISAPNNHLYS